MKNKKTEMLITTLLCLLPAAAGLLVYDRLPERIATHFGINGEPNGWSGRAFAVFFIPVFMAVINLVVQLALNADPKKQNMGAALRTVSVWIVPALSIVTSFVILGGALGYPVHAETIMPLLIGLILIIVGNYLPKTGQNYTVGIKLPWTLASEENWNRTHRAAGFLWFAAGILMIVFTLLRIWSMWLLFAVIIAITVVPCVYSYLLYKKGI